MGDSLTDEYGHLQRAGTGSPSVWSACAEAIDDHWRLNGYWNCSRLEIPKSHALDAACVGDVEAISGWQIPVLKIEAKGRGNYQRTNITKHVFPNGYFMRRKLVCGFRTGDIVKAVVRTGKKIGAYLGRVAVRATGSFKVQTPNGPIDGISWKVCTVQQRADGYAYSFGVTFVPVPQGAG